MLQDVLLKIKIWLKESNLVSDAQLDTLVNLLRGYKKDRIIYPGTIKRHLGIDMKKAYEILNILLDHNLLEINFEIYCNQSGCEKFQNTIYKTINEIPNDLTCEYCGSEINKTKDAIVIFRVK